jgi:hypothetical protein
LAATNRWVGVIIALLGTCLASPQATRMLLDGSSRIIVRPAAAVRRRVRLRVGQLRSSLSRFIPALRRHHVVVTTDSVMGGDGAVGSISITATAGSSWQTHAPTEVKLEALHERLKVAEGKLTQIDQQVTGEIRQREASVTSLREALRTEIAELRESVIKLKRDDTRIDARALPIVGFGILLSGVPDDLARLPSPFGWLLPALGILGGLLALWRALRHPVTET